MKSQLVGFQAQNKYLKGLHSLEWEFIKHINLTWAYQVSMQWTRRFLPPSPPFTLNESSVGRHLSFKLQLTNSVHLTYTLLLVPFSTKPDLKFQTAGLHEVIAKKSIIFFFFFFWTIRNQSPVVFNIRDLIVG